MRILAVDGSRLEFRNNTEVVEAFGRTNKQPDAKPLGIVSALFDVVKKVVLDSSINPADASENHLAFNHLVSSKDTNRPGRHYERRVTRYKLPKFCSNKRSLA